MTFLLPEVLAPLKALPRWMVWRWEQPKKAAKRTKVPYQPNGRKASSIDPKTWCSFEDAVRAAHRYDGIGFALLDSNYGAFDIDDCRDPESGVVHPWAIDLVQKAGSYTEVTPSSTGLRILGYAESPYVSRKLPVMDGVTCELYRKAKRYITISGNVYHDAPLANIDNHIDSVLAELDTKKERPKPTEAEPPNGKKRGRKRVLPTDLTNMLYLTGEKPAGYASRSELLWAYLCRALALGFDNETIAAAALDETYRDGAVFQHVEDNGGRPYLMGQMVKAHNERIVGRPKDDSHKAIVRVEKGRINEAWRAAEAALIKANCPVYVRGGMLVMPLYRWMDTSEKKADGEYVQTLVAHLTPMNRHQLEDMLAHHAAVIQKFDQRTNRWERIDPPKELVEKLLAVGHYGLPDVKGIINSPTIRPDGSLLTEPGYDKHTQLWYKPTTDVVEPMTIPEEPSWDEALTALKKLKELFGGFPFETEVDRSVAIAGLMTVVLRGAMEVVPMFFIRAPEAGTGKTYLVNLIGIIATGQMPAAIACTDDEREMEKRLTAAAIEGTPIIHLNNLTFDLKSALLCHIITDKLVGLRLFYTNKETYKCDCRGQTVFANGNNVYVEGDLVRRTLTCALDAKMDRPETRTFDLDPIEKALKNRREILAAIFTIVRAHIAAGRPKPDNAAKIADFVQWSKFVQHPLMWLKMEDPFKSMEDARKDDPERSALWARIEALKNVFGEGNWFAASDIDNKMKELTGGIGGAVPRYLDLLVAFSSGRDKFSSKSISHQLKKDQKRSLNGYRIDVKPDTEKNIKLYAVFRVGPLTETSDGPKKKLEVPDFMGEEPPF